VAVIKTQIVLLRLLKIFSCKLWAYCVHFRESI